MNEESRIEEFEEKPVVAKSNTVSCGILCDQKKAADRDDRKGSGGRAL